MFSWLNVLHIHIYGISSAYNLVFHHFSFWEESLLDMEVGIDHHYPTVIGERSQYFHFRKTNFIIFIWMRDGKVEMSSTSIQFKYFYLQGWSVSNWFFQSNLNIFTYYWYTYLPVSTSNTYLPNEYQFLSLPSYRTPEVHIIISLLILSICFEEK